MTKHSEIIGLAFAGVSKHVHEYVIPQYGDYGQDLASTYTIEDCVKQAQRYLARHGKSSRSGEEDRDMHKAIHWLSMALYKRSQEQS